MFFNGCLFCIHQVVQSATWEGLQSLQKQLDLFLPCQLHEQKSFLSKEFYQILSPQKQCTVAEMEEQVRYLPCDKGWLDSWWSLMFWQPATWPIQSDAARLLSGSHFKMLIFIQNIFYLRKQGLCDQNISLSSNFLLMQS